MAAGDPDRLRITPCVPVLRGRTVVLRPLARRDAVLLVEFCRDPEAVRWTSIPLDYSERDALAFIAGQVPEGWAAGTTHTFAVADAATDRLLGTIDLHAIRPGAAQAGINIGPPARGSGAAEEACRLLLDYAFEQLNLQVVAWEAMIPNWPSRKLAYKLGFRLEGEVRGLLDDRGTPADAWILTLARDDPRHPQQPWEQASAPLLAGSAGRSSIMEQSPEPQEVPGGGDQPAGT